MDRVTCLCGRKIMPGVKHRIGKFHPTLNPTTQGEVARTKALADRLNLDAVNRKAMEAQAEAKEKFRRIIRKKSWCPEVKGDE